MTGLRAEAPSRLLLEYADGAKFALDLTDIIERRRALLALKNPAIFAAAAISDDGRSVVFGEDDRLELAADNLRARAVEALGEVSHEFIWNWMTTNKLSLEAAANAIGVSRRMLAYYRSGRHLVPRTVALACIGWEKSRIQRTDKSSAIPPLVHGVASW